MTEESCQQCGKEPTPGVILVFAVMGIFWFVVGFGAGLCVPAKKQYRLGYAACQSDVYQAVRAK